MNKRNSIALFLCGCMLAGCASAGGLMRAGGKCDDVWDKLDYRTNYEENRIRHAVPVQPQAAVPAVKPADTNFGACQEDDLVNRTCK